MHALPPDTEIDLQLLQLPRSQTSIPFEARQVTDIWLQRFDSKIFFQFRRFHSALVPTWNWGCYWGFGWNIPDGYEFQIACLCGTLGMYRLCKKFQGFGESCVTNATVETLAFVLCGSKICHGKTCFDPFLKWHTVPFSWFPVSRLRSWACNLRSVASCWCLAEARFSRPYHRTHGWYKRGSEPFVFSKQKTDQSLLFHLRVCPFQSTKKCLTVPASFNFFPKQLWL